MNESSSSFTTNSTNILEHGLYIVATPIGNLRDITLRALDILKSVDIIACEDTRVTAKLKTAYGLKAKTVSYHNHNEEKSSLEIVSSLKHDNKIVALVSDAGTPLMSDPGYKLVQECIKNDISIFSIPGACASIVALTLSGLPANRFLFGGFLPSKSSARRKELEMFTETPASLIFYESNHRIMASLQDMLDVLGDRNIALAREMTKRFEEVQRGSISEIIEIYKDREKIKGEITIVIEPFQKQQKEFSNDEIDQLLSSALEEGMSSKHVSELISVKTGLKKRDLYNRLQELKNENI